MAKDARIAEMQASSRFKRQWKHDASPTKKNKFPEPYTVSEPRLGDQWECSCMNWTRTMPREDCKHILRVKLATSSPLSVGLSQTAVTPLHSYNTPAGRKFRD